MSCKQAGSREGRMPIEVTDIPGGSMDAHGHVIIIDFKLADGTTASLKFDHGLMPRLARNVQQMSDIAAKMRRQFKEDVQFVTVTPYVALDVDASLHKNNVIVKFTTRDAFPTLIALPRQVAQLTVLSIQTMLNELDRLGNLPKTS
jgi:hypothetical protein